MANPLHSDLDAPIQRVAGLDVPIPNSPQLEAYVVPTVEKLTAAARELSR